MIEIARFFDPEEAQIARSYLVAQGLEVILADELALTNMPEMRVGLGGFRLLANERDANIGKRLLAQVQHAHEKAHCPTCKSERLAVVRDIRFPLFHAIFAVIFPFAPSTGIVRCRDCGHRWRPDEDDETNPD